MSFEEYHEDYDHFEDAFDDLKHNRRARRKRKPRPDYKPKVSHDDMLQSLADLTALEAGLDITYTPARHEAVWLKESLRNFFLQDFIRDVLAMVKGGKEASVYRCLAAPHRDEALVAAKVYRPRMFRNLRNDHAYRENRAILTESGEYVKETEHRVLRAIGKKSAYGEMVSHTSWLMYEFTTMEALYRAGASVPKPIKADSNAILMAYIGDAHQAAPTLNHVQLDSNDAQRLFDDVLHNIELLLSLGKVHGDLSAYNILLWEDAITLIDFPQIIDVNVNTQADHIFKRDVQRVCQYFQSQGVDCDYLETAASLWDKHVGFSPNERLRFLEEDEE